MPNANKYRRKVGEVEAKQFVTDADAPAIVDWFLTGDPEKNYSISHVTRFNQPSRLVVDTSEGVATAEFNDWIVKGTDGVFVVRSPENFNNTYEEIPL